MPRITLQLQPDGSQTVATDEAGNAVGLYLPESAGGDQTGVRPMQMLLMGLAGCAAVDILMILKKQRQSVSDFRVELEGAREPNKEPSLWQQVHIVFKFKGAVDSEKAAKAVELSMEKYCSVAETLRRGGASLSWEVVLGE